MQRQPSPDIYPSYVGSLSSHRTVFSTRFYTHIIYIYIYLMQHQRHSFLLYDVAPLLDNYGRTIHERVEKDYPCHS